LFENASDLIQSVDSDGRFRYVNTAWLRKLGYTEDEVAGLTALDIVAPDSTAHWAETFLNVMGGKDAGRVEVDFLTKAGGVITVAGDMNCRFENGRPVEIRAMFRDVTEQRRLAQLKDEFISTVSHELRTPLTSIQGSLGLMSMGGAGELTDQAKELLRIAYSNGDRLVRLINNILDIEKMESGKMEFRLDPIDINELIRQTIEENQPYAKQHSVEYTFDDPGGAVIVNADVDRLAQVMANLLSNAAKFSPENDIVSIHVAERPGWIRVSVKDNGPGIPDSARNLVFEKFSQVDSSSTRQQGGTGLGLSICRAIINKHDGTTFYFDLPRPAAPPVVRPADGVGAKGRVLIVEDDRDVARLLGIMLGRAGYDADVVHSAEEAREALQSARYAVLTLDLRLPGTPGLELLRQVKEDEDTRDLPVIVISAFVDDGKQELNGSAVQVVDWIPKPIDEDRLIAALESAVAPRSSHRARVLHVEDDADLASVTAAILRDVADVTKAASLQAARQAIREETFDLVILDVGLPDGSGLDLLGELGAMPVVVFSAAEMGEQVNTQVAAALLKARTPPEQLVSTIQAILAHRA
ncbi:MAG: response regulator, partial [Candidatus Poribacteria bacterium]